MSLSVLADLGGRAACLLAGACGFSRDSRPVIWSIGQDWRWEAFFAYDCPARCARRIRLVAYGARLESVLGASPRGFESPILRHRTPEPAQVPGFLLLVPRLISGRRESCPPASRPRRELRSARRLVVRPGPAGLAAASNRARLAWLSPGLVPSVPRTSRPRVPRRSPLPGARRGPRPSRTASSGVGPNRCSSSRPRTPNR